MFLFTHCVVHIWDTLLYLLYFFSLFSLLYNKFIFLARLFPSEIVSESFLLLLVELFHLFSCFCLLFVKFCCFFVVVVYFFLYFVLYSSMLLTIIMIYCIKSVPKCFVNLSYFIVMFLIFLVAVFMK